MKNVVVSLLSILAVVPTVFANDVRVSANLSQLQAVVGNGVYEIDSDLNFQVNKNYKVSIFLTSGDESGSNKITLEVKKGATPVCNVRQVLDVSKVTQIICGDMTGWITLGKAHWGSRPVLINFYQNGSTIPALITKSDQNIAISIPASTK